MRGGPVSSDPHAVLSDLPGIEHPVILGGIVGVKPLAQRDVAAESGPETIFRRLGGS